MFAIDLPPDWQATVWSEQRSQTIWQLRRGALPSLTQLGCQPVHQFARFSWCEVNHQLWVLQESAGQFWLTRYRRLPKPTVAPRNNWRGRLLQQFNGQGKSIEVFLNKHHIKQLRSFVELRFTHRRPQFLELDHGRFYLALQNPVEDIFIYPHGDELLLLSATMP
ncbi:hypothetical protein [Pseudidiomarina insulisalsae]|uniref:Uncharacterized protein n=1 Tax=Pseudidiomarina insulisalsae TaxID=575789 RepID=A0A432Y8M1_9GAMM|nr:hypothetical protein [Pseudidiomarina insulisalsae]RUO57335.1 hypothetical protein CWI71_11820 [Pseudidiomarina insulisalsae]